MARKYVRDNRGRFASSGATARGGRLKTASGNKRATQTMQAKGGRAGTIGKPKGLKPGAIKPKPAAKPAARSRAAAVNRSGQASRGLARASKSAMESRRLQATGGAFKSPAAKAKMDRTNKIAADAQAFYGTGTKAGASGQKLGTVPLSQVKRYNALDRARRKEKQTYSRELSEVTGSTDRRRASAAMPKADLASRKISRIESTMRKLSNSPNTPNVPVLPRARKVGEQITGRRNLYRRVTPTTQAPRVANTVARSRPKPKSSSRKPLTGVNSVVGRNLAGFKGLPVSLRSRKQAASSQAARRRNLLSYNAVSTGGTFKRGVNRQLNLLTGRVDRVGAGKFRPVVKRRR